MKKRGLSRESLGRGKPENVLRLARYLGISNADVVGPSLYEEMLTRMGVADDSWPPRMLERRW